MSANKDSWIPYGLLLGFVAIAIIIGSYYLRNPIGQPAPFSRSRVPLGRP